MIIKPIIIRVFGIRITLGGRYLGVIRAWLTTLLAEEFPWGKVEVALIRDDKLMPGEARAVIETVKKVQLQVVSGMEIQE